MACAAVAQEQVEKESSMALGGTTQEAAQAQASAVRHKGKRKRRR